MSSILFWYVYEWLTCGAVGMMNKTNMVMISSDEKKYNSPRVKVVEVKAHQIICTSPGGNEEPEEFPII